MTVKLYLQDIEAAYAREFDAEVTAVDGNTVVLDRTLFYPLGGGQHWDTGTLTWSKRVRTCFRSSWSWRRPPHGGRRAPTRGW